MTDFINNERTFSLEEAEKINETISNFLKNKGINIRHYIRSDTDICYVEGNDKIYGLGKGKAGYQGAFGECIEHLLYEKDVNSVKVIDIEIVKKQKFYSFDLIYQYAINLGFNDSKVACLTFSDPNGNEQFVPVELINYHCFKRSEQHCKYSSFLSKYATTSGSAFGHTEFDSLLHALNEMIERDTTSRFFALLYDDVNYEGYEFRIIDDYEIKFTFPLLVEKLMCKFDIKSMEVLFCNTPFNVSWAFCICRPSTKIKFILPIWGAGCSYYPELAIYRAVTEAYQMMDNYIDENIKEQTKLKIFSERYPKAKNISEFKLNKDICYQTFPEVKPSLSVEEQVETIKRYLDLNDFYTLTKVVKYFENGFLASVYSPMQDRFYNITKATPVLPMYALR
ncbi:MAG: YcaO-like family protein [Vibrio sp.]